MGRSGAADRLVEPERLEDEALAAAARLGELKQPAFRNNKRLAHAETVARVRESLVENVSALMGG